ncbi:DUF4194 domain-containing protein [Acidaminobacter sp. JC074]|uniref:DUF4194 domain-containing protein n=1 Tax=Acidaminobacter sp. JC074 TaxID=2530199 RepID=UPI001F1090CE|nr:DUF4194 domain-containing protein [Acidaminobacter sp. JC074]MCH4891155.1 DUF4194 domain-containing protein [Acidaminobacter sp. JC074]
MMFDIYYDKLSVKDKEEFKKVVNKLLLQNYVLRDVYVEKDKIMRSNYDYRFIERNKSMIENYLDYSGWQLSLDNKYGVAYVTNVFEYNKVTFNKISTIFLLVLRLIYDEEREKLSLKSEVVITVHDLINRMLSVGVFKRKPSAKDIETVLRKLSKFRVIDKGAGIWSSAETKLIIYPTILFILTDAKINELLGLITSEGEEYDDETY